MLASTHGVQTYHPSPTDYWRWTHSGLELLFTRNAEWSSCTVMPGAGTTACVGMVLNLYIDLLAKRLRVRPLALPVLAAVNRLAEAIDDAVPELRSLRPGQRSSRTTTSGADVTEPSCRPGRTAPRHRPPRRRGGRGRPRPVAVPGAAAGARALRRLGLLALAAYCRRRARSTSSCRCSSNRAATTSASSPTRRSRSGRSPGGPTRSDTASTRS